MSAISAHSLYKQYKGLAVVNHVDLDVNSGEIVGLLGPNGAGKTTCFYMIVGLVKRDSGTIRLDGVDISDLPMHERAKLGLGYLPQEQSVFRKLTVEQNILAILETRKELTSRQRRARLEHLLREFKITHKRKTMGTSLSGGERRRVEIARALSMEPSFVLLDEPFAGVDPISVGDIKNLIVQLKQLGIGVLITDHNVQETLRICDRAYIVNLGKILATGSPNEIVKNDKVREIYLGNEFVL